MAKKQIKGTTKLANITSPAQTEKKPDSGDKTEEKLNLVTKKRIKRPTSFVLTPEDKQKLKVIKQTMNSLSQNRKISETLIVRALIHHGQKMKAEKLMELIKDIMF